MRSTDIIIVILRSEYVVDPSEDESSVLQTQEHDASTDAASKAWNEAVQQSTIHCDIFFESLEYSSSQHPSKATPNAQSSTTAAGDIKGTETGDTASDEHHRDQRRQLQQDDNWHVFPNQALEPCGSPDTVLSIHAAYDRRVHLRLVSCHLLGAAATLEAPASSIHSTSESSFPASNSMPTATTANSNAFSLSATTKLYLPVTPLPSQFSWESTPTPHILSAQMDMTLAKQIFMEAWKANHKEHGTAASKTVNKAEDQSDPRDAIKNILADAVDDSLLDTPTGSAATQAEKQHTASEASPTAASCPITEANYEQLFRASLNNNNNSYGISDALFRQNMEIMMKREMQDINAMLAIMGVFAVVLAGFLGWTAHQISHENKNHHSPQNSKTTRLTNGKDVPIEGLTVVGSERRYLPLSLDGTISPLSLDPVLAKSDEARNPMNQLPGDLSPCSKLQVLWWNNRAARRRNRHKSLVPQSPVKAASETNENIRESSELHNNKRFLLHTVEDQLSPITSPVRPLLPERNHEAPAPLDDPVEDSSDATQKQKQPSLFLDELKAKVQPYRSGASNTKENDHQNIVTPETIPSMAPSHTSSFIEDYW
jgi:hypothetical protein